MEKRSVMLLWLFINVGRLSQAIVIFSELQMPAEPSEAAESPRTSPIFPIRLWKSNLLCVTAQ